MDTANEADAAGRGWFEDFEVGRVIRSSGKTFTEAEIVDWALRYDPQPFHMDRDAAERSPYGGLIASGWQTNTTAFRLFMDTAPFAPGASLGAPGVDEVRWRRPVRPGDTVRTVVRVTDRRVSQSDPGRGIVHMDWEVLNQRDEVVMTMRGVSFIRLRPAPPPADAAGAGAGGA